MTEKIVITDFIYEQAGEVCFKCVCCNKVNTIAFAYWDSNVGFLCISCLKRAVEIMEGRLQCSQNKKYDDCTEKEE